MKSVILSTAIRLLVSLLLLASLFLMLRGHNEPGGGFIGGLAAAIALTLYAIADGPGAMRKALRVDPLLLVFGGLIAAVVAGLLALVAGQPFLTGLWWKPEIGDDGFYLPISTPLLFDIGVYLVVIGGICTIVLGLEEDD